MMGKSAEQGTISKVKEVFEAMKSMEMRGSCPQLSRSLRHLIIPRTIMLRIDLEPVLPGACS